MAANLSHALDCEQARNTRVFPVKRALLSVTDKTGLADFARKLSAFGVEILSTGGTAKILETAGVKVTDVATCTGFPEIMDGRVKTLHPTVHGGILARRDLESHLQAMTDHNIAPIDMVVVNLYPFSKVLGEGADYATCVENIDIGGPAMLRAAAKNHDFVAVITDPADYESVIANLSENHGATTFALRQKLAAKAFALTADYDLRIASWMNAEAAPCSFPQRTGIFGTLKQTLRYGENPHQTAALYSDGDTRSGVANAMQIQGKELSYNNLNDTDAAIELVAEFTEPAVAIIKHANPCGVACASSTLEAYRLALRCDPVSAFGGIIALNRPLDKDTAQEIVKIFSEVIIAPAVNDDALAILRGKDKLRVLVTGGMPDPKARRKIVKSIAGGFLVQDSDYGCITESDLKIVTKRAPSTQEFADMLFAFRVAKHVKSNAIIYAKDRATAGIGAGQMSRVDSCRIAARKAQEAATTAGLSESLAIGSVVASDAFFPFADGLITAAEAGVTAVIQPGGSIRDEEVITAADERGLAMVFTGMRHFRH